MRYCSHCGSKLKQNTKYCPECGAPVVWETDNSTNGNSISSKGYKAIILVLLLIIVAAIAFYIINEIGLLKGTEDSKGIATVEVTAPETTEPKLAFSDDPVAISAASQSVVKLDCYDANGELYATGSGFACLADNVIVTNYHVVEDEVFSIEASTEDGSTFEIEYILSSDADNDIAILATSTPHGLSLLKTADTSTLQKGEKVVAIGSPLGLLNSVSSGVFSGYVDENSSEILQFTAAISSGSSGGALFNDAGEVLGITFASYDNGQNLNLAVPIEVVIENWNNRDDSQKLTIAQFYDTFTHSHTVDYIIEHADEFDGEKVTIEGYVSYTYGYVSEGNSIQSSALVTNPNDIIGALFTLEDWDYAAANKSHSREVSAHTIEIHLEFEHYMWEFLDDFTPGNYMECTGTFRVRTLGDFVFYTLYIY